MMALIKAALAISVSLTFIIVFTVFGLEMIDKIFEDKKKND